MRLSPRLHGLFLTRVASQAPMDVDWLCGACLMIRAEAARAAGFLDERFFLYGEDIEWGCRLRDHGWRVVYLPAMHTLHLGGGTQGGLGQNPALGLSFSTRWLDGLAQVYRRRNPRRGLAMLRIFIALGYGGRALVYAAMSLWPSRRIALRGRARAMAIYARYGLRLRAR
jgi:GT2 family glycosyltransferase